MRFAMQTLICCCIFMLVLPLVRGAARDLNTSLKKRFRVWLQSRMRRDLCSRVTVSKRCPDLHVEPQQGQDAESLTPPSSIQLIRSRRSVTTSSKSPGCVLVTCSYHDLIHRLHLFNNKHKEASAPEEKIGFKGYGRRRRSLLDAIQLNAKPRPQRPETGMKRKRRILLARSR
ncbi:hypothetical protein LDENG_00152270 [Lucifuga dentata]|nr:hypothetical protein LDENG_00152270 [Lucifuga dentata]